MAGENITAQPYVDYVQSANTLFHFMKEFGYLKTILTKRAIVPRYCIETMDYLHIRSGELDIQEVAVLQKCFCDIPLHKLADEKQDKLTNFDKKFVNFFFLRYK